MKFREIAQPLAARGFRVFPLIPKTKRPMKMAAGDHFDSATTDSGHIELWDEQSVESNVAIIRGISDGSSLSAAVASPLAPLMMLEHEPIGEL